MSAKRLFSAVSGLVLCVGFSATGFAFHDSPLDPNVSRPLMMMHDAAQTQCQMGIPAACQQIQLFQSAARDMLYYQSQCQQGNQLACQEYQFGAGQINQAFNNFQTASPRINTDTLSDQISHEERMRIQREVFENQNRQWRQNEIDAMERNRQMLEGILR